MTTDPKQEDAPDDATPAKSNLFAQLKEAGVIVSRNSATILALLATVIALVTAYGVKVNQEKQAGDTARFTALSARFAASQATFEKYQNAVAQEKALRDDEFKKLDDVVRQTIQSVSQQQVKMKISPTLEEILNAGVVAQPAAAVEAAKMPVTPVTAPAAAEKKPLVEKKSPSAHEQPAKKLSPQVQSIKDAIQKLNN